MKNKYQRMNPTEKKALINKFKKDQRGNNLLIRLNRLLIIGIIGIIVSLIMALVNFQTENRAYDYISAGILFIFSIVFIIGSIKIKIKELNKFALKK